jgi:signal transduction histidine kinase
MSYLAEIWENTIRSLEDVTRIYADEEISPENELKRAADMIGCHIDFSGERPLDRRATLLLYATVREALTNAVRHANADRLNVAINPTGFGYHVEITDNGIIQISRLIEGNGLSNLRKIIICRMWLIAF